MSVTDTAPAAAPTRATDRRGAVRAFVRMGRAKYLFQSLCAVGLGTFAATYDGHPLRLLGCVWMLASACLVHLMVNYSNEYFDLAADRCNARESGLTGGSGVLVRGLVRPETALGAAFVFLFTALLLFTCLPTVQTRVLSLALLALTWFYSAPPVRLNYRGLGEVASAFSIYGLGPLLCYVVQADTLSPTFAAVVCPITAVQLLRHCLVNLADIDGDRQAGKRTLAVRLGPRRVVLTYCLGQGAVHCCVLALGVTGLLPAAVALCFLATGPIPLWVGRRLLTGAMADRRAAGTLLVSVLHVPVAVSAVMTGLVLHAHVHPPPTRDWIWVYTATLVLVWGWITAWLLTKARRPRQP